MARCSHRITSGPNAGSQCHRRANVGERCSAHGRLADFEVTGFQPQDHVGPQYHADPKLTRCRLGCGSLLLARQIEEHRCAPRTIQELAMSRPGGWWA